MQKIEAATCFPSADFLARSSSRVTEGAVRAGTFWEGRFGLGFGDSSCSVSHIFFCGAVVVAAASVVRPEVVGRRPLDGGQEGIIDVGPFPVHVGLFMSRRLGGVRSKRESEGPASMPKRQNIS